MPKKEKKKVDFALQPVAGVSFHIFYLFNIITFACITFTLDFFYWRENFNCARGKTPGTKCLKPLNEKLFNLMEVNIVCSWYAFEEKSFKWLLTDFVAINFLNLIYR